MSGRALELVARAHLTWKRRVAQGLAPFGVGPKHVFLLRKLSEGEELTPSQVAELLYADRPTTSAMLSTLERRGWIARHPDPDDGRGVRLELTAAGRRKLASVPEELWRSGKTRLDPEAALTPAERAELIRLLEKLIAGMTGT